jgi:hypothetical protein
LFTESGFIQSIGPRDHRDSNGLKKITAQSSSQSPGDRVTDYPKVVVFRRGSRSVATHNAGDELNYQIC